MGRILENEVMTISRKGATVELHGLVDGAYEEVARARDGERFVTAEPFALDFDPVELLEWSG